MKHVHMLPPQEEPAYRKRLRERYAEWRMLAMDRAAMAEVRQRTAADLAADKWLRANHPDDYRKMLS